MKTYQMKLNSIDKVQKFVATVSNREERYEFVTDHNVINAKSILGIFCLDLSKTLELRVEAETLPKELKVFQV